MEQISSITNEKPAYKITFKKIVRAAIAEARVHKKLAIITFVFFGVAMLLFVLNDHFNTFFNQFTMSGWGIAFASFRNSIFIGSGEIRFDGRAALMRLVVSRMARLSSTHFGVGSGCEK